MNTYRCAGDLGDCIYSLPVVRAKGGGVYLIEAADYTRQRLTPDKWCGIDLLLKEQPYISDVQPWISGPVSINLNDFRYSMMRSLRMGISREKNLCDWILEAHGLQLSEKDKPWLTVKEPMPIARVVFNRTGVGRAPQFVYQNLKFPWHQAWKKYGKEAVFIGLPEEHRAFCATCGDVPYVATKNLLDAARVIAGCELFVGNQSVCHAIAQAMHKRVVLEVWERGCMTIFNRPGVVNVWDYKAELPDL